MFANRVKLSLFAETGHRSLLLMSSVIRSDGPMLSVAKSETAPLYQLDRRIIGNHFANILFKFCAFVTF